MNTQEYITKLSNTFKQGNATEHTYRPLFKAYIESLAENIKATNEPKRQKCGAPDYIITKTKHKTDIDIGYIEAKDIGQNLNEHEKTDQLKRYTQSLDNLILTDYFDFRFFVKGQKVAEVKIAEISGNQLKPLPENFAQAEALLINFLEYTGQTIKSAKALASMMAKKAILMKDVFAKALSENYENNTLHDQYEAFKKILIHDLSKEQFADIYAQTVTYGMFTARLHDTTLETFSRQEARELIPKSNPFLRQLFDYISGAQLDDRVVWIVDALCEVYRATNIGDILQDFGKKDGRNDPIVHFYESFLAEYDPKLRKSRGVWYTPEPVVNFIIRAIDDCLKKYFNLPDGLATTEKVKIKVDEQAFDKRTKTGKAQKEIEVHKVQLLDVATGTGTFIAEVVKQIYKAKFENQKGMWSSYVEEHLLPRLHGFEILMASYAMCHLKIDLLLEQLGYKPKNISNPKRLSVYLTNSLEEAHPDTGTLFVNWLSKEAQEANLVKKDMPVMVAFGNPPYSGVSSNMGEWIVNLIEEYKYVDGEHFGERKHWLHDDYVKFIRYGEHYVNKNGEGILAYITNHGYIDNPTFRGMRWHLLNTFDHIYIIDLHGNSKKKEISLDGSIDQNVFDIEQGVAIIIAIKTSQKKSKLAEVNHADFWGKREDKYNLLWEKSLNNIEFKKVEYQKPYYLFNPQNYKLSGAYDNGVILNKLFNLNSTGVQTGDEENLTDLSSEELKNKIFNISEISISEKLISKYTQKPFDTRWMLFLKSINDIKSDNLKIPKSYRSRYNIAKHSAYNPNYCLLFGRSNKSDAADHFFISRYFSEVKCAERTTGSIFCPLYLYQDGLENNREPNLNPKIVKEISQKLGLPFVPDHEDIKADGKTSFSPLDLLDYIYAVLHSPAYREKYKEFLKIDFPRIPYPEKATFWQLVALGKQIRELHLLESPLLAKPICSYDVDGDNKIEKPEYKDGKVYINKTQYFNNVPEIAWNFYIGGYQPAQKWLKDRKTRTLTYDDITHYQKIILALFETDKLMKQIDEVLKV
ncbi:MAG: type ISP restriction/modification enzyme [Alphaproteobacteria bacterium]|jgi:predicted helicase